MSSRPQRSYVLRIRGHFPESRRCYLEPLHYVAEDGEDSVWRGELADQAAMHGLLRRLERAGIPLVGLWPTDVELVAH